MSDCRELVAELYRLPGACSVASRGILARSARVHEDLLNLAARLPGRAGGRVAAEIALRLQSPKFRYDRQEWLNEPLFIAGLHFLSSESRALRRWHQAVAAFSLLDIAPRITTASRSPLGNILLALRLRASPDWSGNVVLMTDAFGRIEFPACDWILKLVSLCSGAPIVLAHHPVIVVVDRRRVHWCVQSGDPFLEMPRESFTDMLVDNAENIDARQFRHSECGLHPEIHRRARIPGSSTRYDAVHFEDFAAHSPVVGGVVAAVLASLEKCSPEIHQEFGSHIRTVRGFELPETSAGIVRTFSDPSLPGVMSINIPFTPRHEPRFSPLCFTWFGHELGHSKSYLIDTIAYAAGIEFLMNGRHSSGFIPRYGRSLRVRTLLQIPYTHLYEWVLLAEFLERDDGGLPWPISEDPMTLGNELRCEIEDAFELIERTAQLTPAGTELVSHLQNLFCRVRNRWDSIRHHGPHAAMPSVK